MFTKVAKKGTGEMPYSGQNKWSAIKLMKQRYNIFLIFSDKFYVFTEVNIFKTCTPAADYKTHILAYYN